MDDTLIRAACLIHQYTQARKKAENHLMDVINYDDIKTDKYDRNYIEVEGHTIMLNQLYGLDSLRGISKIDNDEIRFLFMDALVSQIRGYHTFRTIRQLFPEALLGKALEQTRNNWQKILLS